MTVTATPKPIGFNAIELDVLTSDSDGIDVIRHKLVVDYNNMIDQAILHYMPQDVLELLRFKIEKEIERRINAY